MVAEPMSTRESTVTERDLRRNVLALGGEYGFFMVALTFMSSATVLPAFATWLGASTVVIGAIPAVMTVGWFLPPLFAAAHTERLERKLPFVLRWTPWERVPFAVLTLVAFLLAERAPGLSIALLLLMLLIITGVGGALMPAWMDLVGRTVPTRLRGRFFGLSGLAATVGGLGGTAVTSWALGTLAPATAYGVCFLSATLAIGLSWISLAMVREPEPTTAPADANFRAHLGGIPALLRRDLDFSVFLIARVLGFGATMSTGFLTVYALRVLLTPMAEVGAFTALFLGGQMVGQMLLGWLADRAGHRVVLLLAVGAATLMNLVALAVSAPAVFQIVFALHGLASGASQVSAPNLALEFAPSPERRPTYVGVEKTLIAPFGFGLPLVAGWLIDAVGYALVFGLAAAFGVAAALVYITLVTEPRHRTPR
jgi:MFS family permease